VEFATVLQLIAKYLDTADVDWAVVGGLALTVRGAGRLTHDLDVATERGVQDGLVEYLDLDAESVRGYFEQNDLLDAWEQVRESL